jgi:phage shock protein C
MNTNKRLYKSEDPIFFGVCGGIADYLELDPTLIRILAIILVLAGFGLPLIAYLIAIPLIPRRSDDDPAYIDVKPTPTQAYSASAVANGVSAAAGGSSAAGATGAANATRGSGTDGSGARGATSYAATAAATAATTAGGMGGAPGPAPTGAPTASHTQVPRGTTPPGCAYTACNPQAYDAANPAEQNGSDPRLRHRIRSGVIFGMLLVGVGLLALLDTIFGMPAWSFWPLIIIALGFIVLCTPGRKGWSLARAGHAISLITIGLMLQLLLFGIITTRTFVLSFLYLWPALLVVLGLFVIGGATERSVFKLFGSLFFSATLLFGAWSFGQVTGPWYLNLPGNNVIRFTIPEPPSALSPDDSSAIGDDWLPDR